MREYPHKNATLTVQKVGGGDTASLDLLSGYPTKAQRLKAELTKSNSVALGGFSLHFAALELAELNSFGHQGHLLGLLCVRKEALVNPHLHTNSTVSGT